MFKCSLLFLIFMAILFVKTYIEILFVAALRLDHQQQQQRHLVGKEAGELLAQLPQSRDHVESNIS